MLRQEILDCISAIVQYNILLVTAVVMVLAYAINSESYLICLLPYLIVLPVHFMSEAKSMTTYKLSAYMIVYLEGNTYHWESRHWKFSWILYKKMSLSDRILDYLHYHLHYYLIILSCTAAAIFKITIAFDSNRMWVRIIVVCLLAVSMTVIIKLDRSRRSRSGYIDTWKAVKKEEEEAISREKMSSPA